MSANPDQESEMGTRPAKNWLFCPECDHASPTTGDWVLFVHECPKDAWLAYRCPECERVVTRRRLSDRP
ncbi:hypothetical protein OB905_10790 [Halobacteria archaeon AArc-dxtr1]|nr:hypothetical protein [Halobacteria archaeon AArc-dxtr1]